MAAYFPNVGKKLSLDILLHSTRNPKLRLFKNDVTLEPTLVIGGLTEAAFPGYAGLSLNDMTAAAINLDGKGFKERLANSFTRGAGAGSETIYGWYITIDNLGATQELWMLKKFSAPVVVSAEGHFVEFDLTVFDNLGS